MGQPRIGARGSTLARATNSEPDISLPRAPSPTSADRLGKRNPRTNRPLASANEKARRRTSSRHRARNRMPSRNAHRSAGVVQVLRGNDAPIHSASRPVPTPRSSDSSGSRISAASRPSSNQRRFNTSRRGRQGLPRPFPHRALARTFVAAGDPERFRCRGPTARNSAAPQTAGHSHSPASSRISAA